MNKVLRKAYINIPNGGCTISVETNEFNKTILKLDYGFLGSLENTFTIKTDKDSIFNLGKMLIDASALCPEWDERFVKENNLRFIEDENGCKILEFRG